MVQDIKTTNSGVWRAGLLAAIAAMIFSFTPGVAKAVPIQGSLSMGGSFTAVDASGVATTLDVATGVDFSPFGSGGSFSASAFSDDIDTLTSGAPSFFGFRFGSIKDFSFDTFVPVAEFYSIGDLTFDLDLLNAGIVQTATVLSFSGAGTLKTSVLGYDDTPGIWSFSGDTTGLVFSWSSTTTATTAVPEPASLILLGVGFSGLGLLGFRRKGLKETV